VALGAKVLLAEFPELCGVEQELVDRSVNERVARKFIRLMRDYEAAAVRSGSGFHMNPSPGNIRDGLITDAMKSAGAAKKGGNAPVADVLDYTEQATTPGLSLVYPAVMWKPLRTAVPVPDFITTGLVPAEIRFAPQSKYQPIPPCRHA
jgi:altronate dehydratase